jgi:hypothetical protein
VAGRRAALRLLLVLTATGIVGMHTLGHPTSGGHGASAGHSTGLVSHEPVVEALGAAMTAVVQRDMHGGGMRLDPLSICLAILVGSVLLLLVALLGVHHRSRAFFGHILAALGAAERGPPRFPLGLRLADLSVQRT